MRAPTIKSVNPNPAITTVAAIHPILDQGPRTNTVWALRIVIMTVRVMIIILILIIGNSSDDLVSVLAILLERLMSGILMYLKGFRVLRSSTEDA